MRTVFANFDAWIEERATSRTFLVIQILIAVAFSIASYTTRIQLYPEFIHDICDVSDKAYFGSLCAVIAACLVPLLDLILELVESQKGKSSAQLPFNSFLMERSVVLIGFLIPPIILVLHANNSHLGIGIVRYYEFYGITSALLVMLRALNPVLLTWKTTASLLLLSDIALTYDAAYGGSGFIFLTMGGFLALFIAYLYIQQIAIVWAEDGSDLLATFKNTAALYYSTFFILMYMVILTVTAMVQDIQNVMIYNNLVRVGFITIFFVMGSPKRLGMDLFVLKAS
jgi:hypothetical protein